MFTFRRSYKGPIKAIIVDLAGTIIDYGSCAPAGVFRELFSKYGIEITNEQSREPMGMQKRDHIHKILEMKAVSDKWKQKYGRIWTEKDVDNMYEDFIPMQISSLPRYNNMIIGVKDALEFAQSRGIKVGATTGYNTEMTNIVVDLIKKQGFNLDSVICASDVPQGRPLPWMIYMTMQELNAFPPESVVSFGDTIPDIESALNAGVWSVGVAKTGNMIGLNEDEVSNLPRADLEMLLQKAYNQMYSAGAHYVIDGVYDCIDIIDEISIKLSSGEKP
jgi:phosphonoacetaldehyde hydrolase